MRGVSKSLRFPQGGIARNLNYRDTTYPREDSVYCTPMAVNVIGECAFSSRMRGGSRPGLKSFSGTQPSKATSRGWLWPNGEPMLWGGEDNPEIIYNVDEPTVLPDGAKVLNQHESFSVKATKGSLPDTLSAAVMYRDRFVVAGGNLWYASRTTNHGDFDFGGEADDPTRPMAGMIAKSGTAGENITALMTDGDDKLFITTKRRLCMIGGEIASGMSVISENVGCVSRDAWCSADGRMFFIGANGMYVIADGGVTLVSQNIPEDLKGLSSAILVYDPERNGIHVFASTGDWFYDIESRAFWRLQYARDIRPQFAGSAMVDGVNRVVFYCADSKWRYWDDSVSEEDGSPIYSKVAIGPFKCGNGDDTDGMLDKLTATFARGGVNVVVDGYFGKSAEAALSSAESMTGEAFTVTFGADWNPNVHVRSRGAWCVLVLSANGRWAYESIKADIKVLGGLRYE